MTTRNQEITMNRAVEGAVDELQKAVLGANIVVEPDADGGAFVTVDEVDLGPTYDPSSSFIGFRITFQYPHADVYPHFVGAGVKRKDGKPLGDAFHAGREWITPSGTRAATMVSRKSNSLNPAVDTAMTKLQKVLEWIRSR
jgi:hypothetical protein